MSLAIFSSVSILLRDAMQAQYVLWHSFCQSLSQSHASYCGEIPTLSLLTATLLMTRFLV